MTARSLVTNGASATIPPAPHQRDDADALDANTLLTVLAEVERGDFTTRMPVVWTGVAGKVADALNRVIASNEALEDEIARVSRLVGKEGKLSQRVMLGRSGDAWSGCVNSVNDLLDDLVRPTKEMQRVIGAVADGDLSKKISLDAQGEMLELKNTINAMVDQLNGFISEVTRVAREVGPRAEQHGQRDGGSAQQLRRRGDASCTRSRRGREARRPGAVQGSRWCLEGSHR
jgi:methyl-accepting chemotaxis protein